MTKYLRKAPGKVDVYVEQELLKSIDGWIDCRAMVEMVTCLDMHKVQFVCAEVSEVDDRVICRFSAPDIESVRYVMRCAGVSADLIRAGDVAYPPLSTMFWA